MYTIYKILLINLYLNFFPCRDWVWISTCFFWLTSNIKLDRFMHMLVHCSESNKFCFSLAVQKTWKGNNVSQGNLNYFDFYSDRKIENILRKKMHCFTWIILIPKVFYFLTFKKIHLKTISKLKVTSNGKPVIFQLVGCFPVLFC